VPVFAVGRTPTLERRGSPSLLLPELLRELYLGCCTGIFHVARGTDRVSVCFRHGEVVSGSSTSNKVRLGETMVRHGLLPLEDLVRALVVVHRDGRRLGPVLMEMGIIDAPGLERALALHLREMLLTALGWDDAAHVFEDRELPVLSPEDLTLASSTGELILEVVRRISSREMVRLGLGDLDRILAALPHSLARLDRVTLNTAERYVVSRVDGRTSARSMIEIAGLPADDIERSLLGLLCAGIIDYRPRVTDKQRPAASKGGGKEGAGSTAIDR